jgi:hypothetical protein
MESSDKTKQYFLMAMTIFSAYGFYILIFFAIFSPGNFWSVWVAPFLMLMFFLTFLSLCGVLIESRRSLRVLAILVTFGVVLVVPFLASNALEIGLYAVALTFLFIEVLEFFKRIKNEQADRVRFSMYHLIHMALPKLIFSAAFFITVSFFLIFKLNVQISPTQYTIPETLFAEQISLVAMALKPFYEGINQNTTLGDIVDKQISQSANVETFSVTNPQTGQKIPFSQLDSRTQAEVRRQLELEKDNAFDTQISNLSKQLGVNLKASDKVSSVVTKVVNSKIENFLGKYSGYTSAIFAGILFLTLISLVPFVRSATQLTASLAIRGLRGMGWVKMSKYPVEQEKLTL